jgi:hypothetical protein
MSKSLSLDLRERVLLAVKEGMSGRQASLRFGVSASSAIPWRALERAQGDAKPKALGGDRPLGSDRGPRRLDPLAYRLTTIEWSRLAHGQCGLLLLHCSGL